jgi:hypothetical protein
MRSLALLAVLAVACGGGSEAQSEGARTPTNANVTSIEIAELDISGKGIDRFTSCPPPGELGQDWIPKLPPWSPPAPKSERRADPEPLGLPPPAPDGRTPTEKAIFDTYPDFRRCYQKGLLHDPTQDGHAAIVLRVGADGKVAAVESYGVCELSTEVVGCMRDSASKLRFVPPASGTQTITIPAVFTTRGGRPHEHPSPNDSYTAAAYTRLEEARPDLHVCEQNARGSGQELQANATFLIDLDAEGRIAHTHIENWQGNQQLLSCAAHALEKLAFDKPPAGRGSILARISFNPRAGTK